MLNLSPPVDAGAVLLSTRTLKTIYGSMLSTFVPFPTEVPIAATLHHGTIHPLLQQHPLPIL